MRAIKVYCPPGVEPPLYAFIDALDGKLKAKLLWQIFRLRNLSAKMLSIRVTKGNPLLLLFFCRNRR